MLRWVFEAIKVGDRREATMKLIREQLGHIHELVDGSGCTLLHAAANHRNTEAIELIFSLYEQRAATDELFSAEHRREWVNQRDNRGFTALHYAVFRQDLVAVQLLERQGADIYLCSGDGLNCLHLAAQGGSPLLMLYFMSKGMKISSTDSGGSTPLHWACYSGAENAVAALMAWGAELDCQENVHGATPLHLAVIAGNERIVKWMLLAGCDRTLPNKKGQTAHDLAIEKKEERIAEMIEDRCSLLALFNLKSSYHPIPRRGFPFYFLSSMFLLSFVSNFAYFYPPQQAIADATVIASLILGVLLGFLFVFLGASDPGRVAAREEEGRMGVVRRGQASRICFRCNIVRPARARHCSTCNRCVSVYDHHCPWIGNCIGARNYLRFFAFLIILEAYLLFNIVYHIANLTHAQRPDSPAGALRILASVLNLLLGALFALPLLYLIFINARNASHNRTAFEIAASVGQNRQKLKSKAMTIETQLTESISTTSKNSKTIDLLESEGEETGTIGENCWAMCVGNSRVPEYRHA